MRIHSKRELARTLPVTVVEHRHRDLIHPCAQQADIQHTPHHIHRPYLAANVEQISGLTIQG